MSGYKCWVFCWELSWWIFMQLQRRVTLLVQKAWRSSVKISVSNQKTSVTDISTLSVCFMYICVSVCTWLLLLFLEQNCCDWQISIKCCCFNSCLSVFWFFVLLTVSYFLLFASFRVYVASFAFSPLFQLLNLVFLHFMCILVYRN